MIETIDYTAPSTNVHEVRIKGRFLQGSNPVKGAAFSETADVDDHSNESWW